MKESSLDKIELSLMTAELHLDGINTHNHFKNCLAPDYAKKISLSLSAVRSARDILRKARGMKQITLTTPGLQADPKKTYGWYFHPRKNWKCSLCDRMKQIAGSSQS